ncbi:MAG TPA: hypothetical protein VFQ80_17720 [Thermomicrobiales bacterium]|nr:hypothetical protein [Thermomicrobiales bacterium]
MIRRFGRRFAAFGLLALAAVGATFALVVGGLIVPGRTALFLRWYLLVVGVLVIVGALHAIALRFPVDWRPPAAFAPAPAAAAVEPPQRQREIERLVAYSGWDAADFHARLRPILRHAAAQRLAAYRTIDLDANPAAARQALGERVWTLLEPKDPTTIRRDGGIAAADLQTIVATLEALDDEPHR